MLKRLAKNAVSAILPVWVSRPWLQPTRYRVRRCNMATEKVGVYSEMAWTGSRR